MALELGRVGVCKSKHWCRGIGRWEPREEVVALCAAGLTPWYWCQSPLVVERISGQAAVPWNSCVNG